MREAAVAAQVMRGGGGLAATAGRRGEAVTRIKQALGD